MSQGSDDNISFLTFFYQVFAAAVAYCYRGIARIGFLHHQGSHRFADDIATSEYNTFFAGSLYFVTFQQFEDTVGSSGYIARKSDGHTAYVDRVEAVYIFTVINRFDYFLFGDMFR